MLDGSPAVGISNSVTVPVGVIRPILLTLDSINHRLPSGPAVMSYDGEGAENSTMSPVAALAPTPCPATTTAATITAALIRFAELAILVARLFTTFIYTPASLMLVKIDIYNTTLTFHDDHVNPEIEQNRAGW